MVTVFGRVYHLGMKPSQLGHSALHPRSLNREPALIGWGKRGKVTSTEWQVTLCDPVACDPVTMRLVANFYTLPLPLTLTTINYSS